MEIDITSLVVDTETWDLTGSVATHGPSVAQNTWNNAKREASDRPLLTTEEELEAMRRWMQSTGAWDATERAAMTDVELNALFLQLVAGYMREMGLEDCDPEDFNWREYQERVEQGQISGNIWCDAEGRRYLYSLDD